MSTRTNTHSSKPAPRKANAKPPVRVSVPALELHPAEHAGMVVHQTIENGVGAVKDTVITAGGYVFGFVKGLIKGH